MVSTAAGNDPPLITPASEGRIAALGPALIGVVKALAGLSHHLSEMGVPDMNESGPQRRSIQVITDLSCAVPVHSLVRGQTVETRSFGRRTDVFARTALATGLGAPTGWSAQGAFHLTGSEPGHIAVTLPDVTGYLLVPSTLAQSRIALVTVA